MKPLEGLKILAVEHFAAGPYGTMYLADMGATVIKIENSRSGGDAARAIGPYFLGEGDSLVFQGWNTCKHSLSLDLKQPEDRRKFDALVRSSDAIVNNLRGDQPAKIGLDYKALSALKRDIVCLHISAYGRNSSRAGWPGYDYLMQAEAGLMHVTGDPAGEPTRFGVSVIDFMTGVTGVLGLLAALRKAASTGQGGDVDVSLFDVALHILGYAGTWYLNESVASERTPRGSHMSVSPVQTFTAADGWIYVMCMTQRFWEIMVDELGRRDLLDDPRFATQVTRSTHRDALTAILDPEFAKHPTRHWLTAFEGTLPVAPIYDVKQALDNPFVAEVEMIAKVPHPLRPDMRLLANPLKFDGARLEQVVCSAFGEEVGHD